MKIRHHLLGFFLLSMTVIASCQLRVPFEDESEVEGIDMNLNADNIADDSVLYSYPHLLPGLKAKQVATGGYQSALISAHTGEVYHWGLVSRKGSSVPSIVNFPSSLPGDHRVNISMIALGGYHILAVDEKGRLYSWGRGDAGALGHGGRDDEDQPKLIQELAKRKVRLVAAGYGHSVAVTDQGIYTWGSGSRGQLGSGHTRDILAPRLIKIAGLSAKRVSQVCAGGHHSSLLSESGEVYTFGGNSFGALGLGHTKDILVPTVVKALAGTTISQISCGGDHTLAVSTDGKLYSWGWGSKGQLGLGDTNDCLLPTLVDFSSKLDQNDFIVSASAGGYANSFVVTAKGHLLAFGWGEAGILGNGRSGDELIPSLVMSSVAPISTISAGGYKHALVLTPNGDAFVFGEDTFGQLGLGTWQAAIDSNLSIETSGPVIDSLHAIS